MNFVLTVDFSPSHKTFNRTLYAILIGSSNEILRKVASLFLSNVVIWRLLFKHLHSLAMNQPTFNKILGFWKKPVFSSTSRRNLNFLLCKADNNKHLKKELLKLFNSLTPCRSCDDQGKYWFIVIYVYIYN